MKIDLILPDDHIFVIFETQCRLTLTLASRYLRSTKVAFVLHGAFTVHMRLSLIICYFTCIKYPPKSTGFFKNKFCYTYFAITCIFPNMTTAEIVKTDVDYSG